MTKNAESVFIIDGVRTAIANRYKGLQEFSVAQISAVVIKEIILRNQLAPQQINEIILGNTVSAGTGQNFARQALVLAGFPMSLPAYTVNNVCGAGLQSVIGACRAIRSEDAEMVIAGGAESASKTPLLLDQDRASQDKGSKDSLQYDGFWCSLSHQRMGDLCEAMIRKYNISRSLQDQYSLESHMKAVKAQKEGKFNKEIVGVPLQSGGVFNQDERPRENLTLANLQSLTTAFKRDGTLTAGNSSVPADGGCAVLLSSPNMVKQLKLKPAAKVLGYLSLAVNPQMVFESCSMAIQECLKGKGLTVKDIDLYEINEAFAAQAILVRDKLKIPEHKINIWGGDIALGHPLGAVGTRILVTLLHALQNQEKNLGLACVSFGGGGSIAVIVENLGHP